MQAYHRLVSVLQRIRQDVATLLDKEAINAARLARLAPRAPCASRAPRGVRSIFKLT